MRRATQILLVLMGGGAVAAVAVPALRRPDCDAVQQANGACSDTAASRNGSSGSHYYGVSSGGRSGVARVAGAPSVSRGGFGASGAAHGSGG